MAQLARHKKMSLYEAYLAITPMRVLVAENDPRMRNLIASMLREDGFEVVEAADGDELLELIGTLVLRGHGARPIDLIISDARMPGRSGLETLAGLRRADWAMPVILITACEDEELHAEAKRLGASAVFVKPFDLNDLRTAAVVFALH